MDNGVQINKSEHTFKEFTNAKFDMASRTFEGRVDWQPTSWEGEAYLEYTMLFAPDFKSIEGGQVAYFSEAGVKLGESPFGEGGQSMVRLAGYSLE